MANRIHVIGSIDDDSYKEFTEVLGALENSGQNKKVVIELSSVGGDVYSALAFASRIRTSPLEIHVEAHGLVASAAVIILAVGDKRRMAEECLVMVHEDSGKVKGELKVMEREVAHLRRMENLWNSLLESYTGTKASVWANLHSKELYLTAKECLSLKLVDEII